MQVVELPGNSESPWENKIKMLFSRNTDCRKVWKLRCKSFIQDSSPIPQDCNSRDFLLAYCLMQFQKSANILRGKLTLYSFSSRLLPSLWDLGPLASTFCLSTLQDSYKVYLLLWALLPRPSPWFFRVLCHVQNWQIFWRGSDYRMSTNLCVILSFLGFWSLKSWLTLKFSHVLKQIFFMLSSFSSCSCKRSSLL